MFTSKLTAKAQTTIPKQVRTALHLEPGDELVYVIKGHHVILTKANKGKAEASFRSFNEWNSAADTKAYADL
jgi:antitoxin PrlF